MSASRNSPAVIVPDAPGPPDPPGPPDAPGPPVAPPLEQPARIAIVATTTIRSPRCALRTFGPERRISRGPLVDICRRDGTASRVVPGPLARDRRTASV